MSQTNGRYFFRVSPGSYTVSIHVPGYQSEQRSVDLTDTMSSENIDFRLKDDGSARSTTPATPTAGTDSSVPANARDEFEKGATAIADGKKEKIQEGINHLDKAVALYPNYLQAHFLLGTTYGDLKQWDKAEAALRKVLEINPKAANALFALGELYLRQKKDDQAEKMLLQGLEIEDRSFQGHLTLGLVYWDVGSKFKEEAQWRPLLEKAYDQTKRALELNPDLAGAHLLKGNLLFKVRRAEDAVHEYEEYLRLDPNGPFAEATRTQVDRIKKALAGQKP